MVIDPPDRTRLHAEARLWLEWARGAAGPWLVAEEPAPYPSTLDVSTGDGATGDGATGDGATRDGPTRGRGGAPVRERRPDPAGAADAEEVAAAAALTPAERDRRLAEMAGEVAACARCLLAAGRTCTVFGEGSHQPRLVIVGEAPGAEEDRSGRPFVGPAGQMLTRMLAGIGLAREDVFIANLLKCRPPGNRNPRPEEVAACKPFLREQLRLLQPQLILALGSPAARELLQTRRGIMSLRGRFSKTPDGFRVMPTFHPAYLLRRPEAKRDAWGDLKKVAADLGLEIPPVSK